MKNDHKLNSDHSSEEKRQISTLFQMLLLFLALIFLSGCSGYLPQPQEMGNMLLLRSFAVDKEENWQVTSSSGQRAGQEPLVLTGSGRTLAGASQNLHAASEHSVFFGYVDQLILGKSAMGADLYEVLDYFTQDSQLSLGTGIWLHLGEAQTFLEGDVDSVAYLHSLQEESRLGLAGICRKTGEVLADLKGNGKSYLPILTSEEGKILENGYAVLDDGEIVGLLQEELATGLMLLECHSHFQELSLPQGNYAVSVQQIKSNIWGTWDDQKLISVDICLSVEVDFIGNSQDEKALLTAIGDVLSAQGAETLSQLQFWDCDALNLGNALALGSPPHKSLLENQWETWFPEVDFHLTVKVEREGV